MQRALGIAHGGRPITEQNLSVWRQGAFLDSKRHRDSCEWVSQMAGGAEQMANEAGLMPLSESLASFAVFTLGKRLQELGTDGLSDTEKRAEFLQLVKELTRMRSDNMRPALLHMCLESYEQNHGRGPC